VVRGESAFLETPAMMAFTRAVAGAAELVAADFSNTLALGGATNAIFDVSQIGEGEQYQGFENFQKTGSSTWVLLNNVGHTALDNQQWHASGERQSVNSPFTVNGGTLAGTGMIGAVTVNTNASTRQATRPATVIRIALAVGAHALSLCTGRGSLHWPAVGLRIDGRRYQVYDTSWH
jgi:hypothetical protein